MIIIACLAGIAWANNLEISKNIKNNIAQISSLDKALSQIDGADTSYINTDYKDIPSDNTNSNTNTNTNTNSTTSSGNTTSNVSNTTSSSNSNNKTETTDKVDKALTAIDSGIDTSNDFNSIGQLP